MPLPDPNEALDDVLSLCAKVLHDIEQTGRVRIDDLCQLRDSINDVRKAVANGAGYKAVPRVARSEEDI